MSKAFELGDQAGRPCHVGGLVDIGRVVAGADADRRIARAVGGAHHRRAAGGEDQVDTVGGHHRGDDRHRRVGDHLDDAVRRARLLGDAGEETRGVGAAGLGRRVGADDDGIPGQQGDDRLVEDRADRIGRRGQREDHAGRLRDGDGPGLGIDPEVGVVLVLVVVEEAGRAEPVLDFLVIGIAEAAFLDRPLGIAARLGGAGFRHRFDDGEDGGTRIGRERGRGPARLLDHLRRLMRRQPGVGLVNRRRHEACFHGGLQAKDRPGRVMIRPAN